ncbi:MAG: aromatic amino acid transport family protein [Nanoarchaeota archaeon]
MSKTLTATAILITTMIGAGFLGMPYVISQSGFAIGILELVAIGTILMVTMLYLGEIVLRTKEHHQLTGYAEKYLGQRGKKAMAFSLVVGIYSALIAYLIAQGESWSFIITNTTYYALPLGIAIWALMSAISYFDIRTLKRSETLVLALICILLILLAITSIPNLSLNNLQTISIKNAFSPLGIILFSFLGYSAVPEIARILKKDKSKMKRSIIYAHSFVLFVYALFTFLVLGVYSTNTPEVATLALGKPFVLLGIITIFGAYISLSIALMDMFRSDYQFKKNEAWAFTTIIPLALFIILSLTNNLSFTKILSFGGIIAGGLALFLILAMVKQAKLHGNRHPEYKIPYSKAFIVISIIILAIGLFTEIKNLI